LNRHNPATERKPNRQREERGCLQTQLTADRSLENLNECLMRATISLLKCTSPPQISPHGAKQNLPTPPPGQFFGLQQGQRQPPHQRPIGAQQFLGGTLQRGAIKAP